MKLTLIVPVLAAFPLADPPPTRTAEALIERAAREKAPVWTDGDTVTFFHRGEADAVTLLLGGDTKTLTRLPESDVWAVEVPLPRLQESVLTYAILPRGKDEPVFKPGRRLPIRTWRGPKAPPAPARVETADVKGKLVTRQFDSKALGGKRGVRVYLPPGHDRAKAYPVVYATDARVYAEVLDPLIVAGAVRPVVVVGVEPGGYLGDRKPGEHDIKKDLRALEYLPGADADRFKAHEAFFCEEIVPWAEAEFGASADRADRAVFGCSNGARFAVEMGLRRPGLFGHVIGLSVAGGWDAKAAPKADGAPRYHLAAGIWEKGFHAITTNAADGHKAVGVRVAFTSRVSGHDDAMWQEEFAAAVTRAWGKE